MNTVVSTPVHTIDRLISSKAVSGKRSFSRVDSSDSLNGVEFQSDMEHDRISTRIASNLDNSQKKLRVSSPNSETDCNEIFSLFISDMPLPDEAALPKTEFTFDATALNDFLSYSSSKSEDGNVSFWADIFVMEQES